MKSKFNLIFEFFSNFNFEKDIAISEFTLYDFILNKGIKNTVKFNTIKEILIKRNLISNNNCITLDEINYLYDTFVSDNNLEEIDDIFSSTLIEFSEIVSNRNDDEFQKTENLKKVVEINEFEEKNLYKKNELIKSNNIFSYTNDDLFDLVSSNKNIKKKHQQVLSTKEAQFFFKIRKKQNKIKVDISKIAYINNISGMISFIEDKILLLTSVINLNEIIYMVMNNFGILDDVIKKQEVKEAIIKSIASVNCDITEYPLYFSGYSVDSNIDLIEIDTVEFDFYPDWVIKLRNYFTKEYYWS